MTSQSMPHREREYHLLHNLLDSEIVPPLVHISGPRSSGKSSLVRCVCEIKNLKHVFISCRVVSSQREFFDEILNQMNKQSNFHPSMSNDWKGWRMYSSQHRNCRDASTFKDILRDMNWQESSFYIILDDYESLQSHSPKLLSGLVRIFEDHSLSLKMHQQLGLVLIGNATSYARLGPIIHPSEMRANRPSIGGMAVIRLRQYTAEQMKSILSNSYFGDCRIPISMECKRHVVDLLVDSFGSSRVLSELQKTLVSLVTRVESMIERQRQCEQKEEDLDGTFIDCFVDQVGVLLRADGDNAVISDSLGDGAKSNSAWSRLELPFASKYLLLSAFLAAQIPPKLDERIFASTERRRVRRRGTKKSAEISRHRQQTFPLERLQAIFRVIFVKHTEHESFDLVLDSRCQIRTLVSSGMLTRVGASLDNVKFQCNISKDAAMGVAESVRFPLKDYLAMVG